MDAATLFKQFAAMGASIRHMGCGNAAMPLACERTGGTFKNVNYEGRRPKSQLETILNAGEHSEWARLSSTVSSKTKTESKVPPALADATLIAFDGYGRETGEARVAAELALSMYPACPEAYALLGLYSDSLEDALGHYRAGEALGEHVLEVFAEELKSGNGWSILPVRSYIRCLHGVANCLRKLHAQTKDEAMARESLSAYQRLLRVQPRRLNGADYVNFCYHLPEAYLRCNDLAGFDKLWSNRRLGEEMCNFMSSNLSWTMSRALRDYKKEPELARWQWLDPSFRELKGVPDQDLSSDTYTYKISSMGGAIFYAISNFPIVLALLTGKQQMPEGSLPLTYGSSETLEQAVAYVHSAGDLWDEGARKWLLEQNNMIQLLDKALHSDIINSATTRRAVRLIKDGIPTADIGPVAYRVPGPLHKCCYYDHPLEIISALLEAGINPLATGGPKTGPDEGHTPVGMAANQGNYRPLRLVLEFCKPRYPKQFTRLLREAIDAMLCSSVYFCVSGKQPGCQRCYHMPHGPHVSFTKCIDVLLDMGLTEKEVPRTSPYGRKHTLLKLIQEKLQNRSMGGSGSEKITLSAAAGDGDGELKMECRACGKSEGKMKLCSSCRIAYYCSHECQKKDWKAGHKKTCAGRK